MNDSPRRAGNKVGSNKGIARREHERRRAEAEQRNARTPEERTRVFREGPVGKRTLTARLPNVGSDTA